MISQRSYRKMVAIIFLVDDIEAYLLSCRLDHDEWGRIRKLRKIENAIDHAISLYN